MDDEVIRASLAARRDRVDVEYVVPYLAGLLERRLVIRLAHHSGPPRFLEALRPLRSQGGLEDVAEHVVALTREPLVALGLPKEGHVCPARAKHAIHDGLEDALHEELDGRDVRAKLRQVKV